MDISKNLRVIRRVRGLTLSEAGALTGIKPVVLGSYERGQRAVSLERAEQLAKGYKVSLIEVLGLADEAVAFAEVVELRESLTKLESALAWGREQTRA
jgi:transcriptional regulator with XRE-family HTH domain